MKIKKILIFTFISFALYVYPFFIDDLIRFTHMESLVTNQKELEKKIKLYHPDKDQDFILKSIYTKISEYINLFKGKSIKDITNPLSDLNSTIKNHIEGGFQKAFLDIINNYDITKIEKFKKILGECTGQKHKKTIDYISQALKSYMWLKKDIKYDHYQLTEQQVDAFQARDIDEIIKTTNENPYSLFISPKTREAYIDYMNNLIIDFEKENKEDSAKRLEDIAEKLKNAPWFKKDVAGIYDYSSDAIKNHPLIDYSDEYPADDFFSTSIKDKINNFFSAQKKSDNPAKLKYAIGLMLYDFLTIMSTMHEKQQEIALRYFIKAVKNSPLVNSLSIPLVPIAETFLAEITGKQLPTLNIDMSSLTTLKDLKREIETIGLVFEFNKKIYNNFLQKFIDLYTSNETAENQAIFDGIYIITDHIKPDNAIKAQLDNLFLNDSIQKLVKKLTDIHTLL